MNARIAALLTATGACLLLAACSGVAEYPVSYQIPIGLANFSSDYGVKNLAVNAVQDVPVQAGRPFSYSIVSPVVMNVYIFDKYGPDTGGPLLANVSGVGYTGVVTPLGSELEFVFSAPESVDSGVMHLTVSNAPIGATTTTDGMTTTTTTTYAAAPALAPQPPLVLSPGETTTSILQPVTLTVAGGAGNGAYVWGGPAKASGISNMYSFNTPGTYTVTVYRTGDASYSQSNTATSKITVTAPQAITAYPTVPGVAVTPLR